MNKCTVSLILRNFSLHYLYNPSASNMSSLGYIDVI